MKLRGVDQEVINTAMADAIKRAGIKVRKPRSKSWPRLRRNQPECVRLEGGIVNLHFATINR